jgi:hypothetical protein
LDVVGDLLMLFGYVPVARWFTLHLTDEEPHPGLPRFSLEGSVPIDCRGREAEADYGNGKNKLSQLLLDELFAIDNGTVRVLCPIKVKGIK